MSGLRERVEALLAEGPDTWTPYESRDTGWTFLQESVLDFTADLRAALTTANEPTALAGYMVADDAFDVPTIWRERDLFPVPVLTANDLRNDPALWDVLVAAVERGQA